MILNFWPQWPWKWLSWFLKSEQCPEKNEIHIPNNLTFRKRITELRLKSSKKPHILTTMSVIVGSQTPLLQNPVLQGVPSGSISSGCITKHEVFKFIRQHRLQESGVVSHMQVWKYKKYIIFIRNPIIPSPLIQS